MKTHKSAQGAVEGFGIASTPADVLCNTGRGAPLGGGDRHVACTAHTRSDIASVCTGIRLR